MSGLDPGAGGGKRITTITVHTQGDDRVCPICAPHNGRTYDADSVPAGALPPFHGNCRCYVTVAETGATLDQADVEELGTSPTPVWDEAREQLEENPPGPGNTLKHDPDFDFDPPTFPAAGAGPWENTTSLIPHNPKGDPWG